MTWRAACLVVLLLGLGVVLPRCSGACTLQTDPCEVEGFTRRSSPTAPPPIEGTRPSVQRYPPPDVDAGDDAPAQEDTCED